MNNKAISELYDDGIISGETYLYCVENNINTLEEAVSLQMPASSGRVFSELQEIIQPISNDGSTPAFTTAESLKDNCVLLAHCIKLYNKLFYEYGVRTKNVLKMLRAQHPDNADFFIFLLGLTQGHTGRPIRNAGKLTLSDLQEIAQRLNSELATTTTEDMIAVKVPDTPATTNTENDIEGLLPMIESEINKLSARSKNALTKLLIDCDSSLRIFYDTISAPSFSIHQLPNVGRKSAREIEGCVDIIKQTLVYYTNTGSEEVACQTTIHNWIKHNIVSDVNARYLFDMRQQLQYFPIFKAIDLYINQLPRRDKTILNGQVEIYNNQQLESRDDIGERLGITGERVRQLKLNVFELLCDFATNIRTIGGIANTSNYEALDISIINHRERTNFQDNFIFWIISLISDKYKILGDAGECFYNPYDKQVNLCIVPVELDNIFDFELFIGEIAHIFNKKHYDDYHLDLQPFLLKFFRTQTEFEYVPDIIKECKTIINRLFDCYFKDNCIVIESNAERNIGDIAELIIRDNGKPMSGTDIYAAFIEQHPGKTKSLDSFVSSVRTHKNIKAIGKTSTYALREWNDEDNRGCTIREIAIEYLLKQEQPIAPLKDIANFVRRFRPNTKDNSIQYNLQAEESGRFSLYLKYGERYIGLTAFEYEEAYILNSRNNGDGSRDFKTSCTLLEKFITINGHFPFSISENEDEMRLSRFWNVTKRRKDAGTLTNEEEAIVGSINNRLSQFAISKNDYIWLQKYAQTKQILTEEGRQHLDSSLQAWFYKYSRLYTKGELLDWQTNKIAELITLK